MSRITLLLTLLLVAALAGPTLAHAGSPDVVVSQVYGGGGNAGAPLRNDFVELFNRGTTAVDLSGWTVQYATAAGATWQSSSLAGTILPGRYYLLEQASGGDAGDPLASPDASGTITLSASSGKVALVRNGDSLTCGASPGSCSSSSPIADLIGYGSAVDFEGSAPAPGPGSATAALRADGGCADTNVNGSDFVTGAPAPRNSVATPHFCAGDEPPAMASSQPAAGASGVALDASIRVSFSEPVEVSPGWYEIVCSASGAHAALASGGPQAFTLTPSAAFASGESCTVTIVASAVHDLDSSDPPDAMSASSVFSFSTGPQQPPASGTTESEAGVDVEIQSVLTVSLEKPALDFGRLAWRASPAPISERVTVVSNAPGGYVLSVHRSAFVPDDLPLGVMATAPAGGRQLAAALAGGNLVPIPVPPAADLTIGESSAMSADGGDVWPTSIGFATPIPLAREGRYTATLTFTVVGR